MPYREKRYIAGQYQYIDIFPVTQLEVKSPRGEKTKISSPKQRALNDKNAKRHLAMLVNTNFTDDDLVSHLTYDQDHLPASPEEAMRDVTNFIRRIKTARKRKALPDLKYIAVVEYRDPEDSKPGVRIHHHIIMSGGLSRDEVERIWKKGRCNTDRLQADEAGYEGLARYISKDPRGSKRWCQSKNLKQPEVHVNDFKYSRKRVEQLARCPGERELFESLYPGYTLTTVTPEVNEISGGTYIYIKMRRRPDPARKEVRRGQTRKRDPALLSG